MPHRVPTDWLELIWVDTAEVLSAAIDVWRKEGVVGLDCESNSFFAYKDKLCLLQATCGDQDWVIDPLALGDDMKLLNPILADESVIKIFHAAEFDLMLLKQALGADLKGLFDTQVAMTLLGHTKTGLAALIESYCGMKPSKKEQRSNWGARPLTDAQVAYARLDTHFLPDLHQRLRDEVIEKGMLDHAEHEFERQVNDVLPPREPNMEGWLKFKGVKKFTPEAAARVRALFQWRELRAMEIDKPVFRVLPNDTILDLGDNPPKDMRDLAGRRGVGWRVAKKVGDEMMAALAAVEGETVESHISKPLSQAERRQRRTARENQDALRTWRKKMAQELELPSERLMHRRQLEKIAEELPRTSEALQRTLPMNDWQRENLEPSLLALLGKLPDPQQA